jgi:MFS family permease
VADRLGRRNTIALSMLSAASFTLLLWQAHSLALIYPLMFCLAATAELYRPASSALIADLVPSEQRVTAFTLYRLAVNVGWACGLALGGFLAERSFALLFVGDAATSAAFGVIALVALPHGRLRSTRSGTYRRSNHDPRRPGVPAVPRCRCSTGIVYSQNVSTLPLHVTAAGHPASTTVLQAFNGMLVVLSETGHRVDQPLAHAGRSAFLIRLGFIR